jgi:hypothetical protein
MTAKELSFLNPNITPASPVNNLVLQHQALPNLVLGSFQCAFVFVEVAVCAGLLCGRRSSLISTIF